MRSKLLLIATAAVLAACTGYDDPSGVGTSTGAGRVRLVNASPDTVDVGTINAWFNNQPSEPLTANLGYGLATEYRARSTGGQDLNVRRFVDTSLVVFDVTVDVAADAEYTVLATGLTPNVAALVLRDDNAAPAAGAAKLRVVHAAPSGGIVDVYVTAANVSDITGREPTAAGATYKNASAYLAVAPGDQRVRLTGGGTKTVILDFTVGLAAGQVRSLIVLDRLGGGDPLRGSLLVDRNP
jgi:trimeric autotransporter adhesin